MLLLILDPSFFLPSDANITEVSVGTYTLVFVNGTETFVVSENGSVVEDEAVIEEVLQEYYSSEVELSEEALAEVNSSLEDFLAPAQVPIEACKVSTYYSLFRCPWDWSCDAVARHVCQEVFFGMCDWLSMAEVFEAFGRPYGLFEEALTDFQEGLRPEPDALVESLDRLDILGQRAEELEATDLGSFCEPILFNWTAFNQTRTLLQELVGAGVFLSQLDERTQEVLQRTRERLHHREVEQNYSSFRHDFLRVLNESRPLLEASSLLLDKVNDTLLREYLLEFEEISQMVNSSLEARNFSGVAENISSLEVLGERIQARFQATSSLLEAFLERTAQVEALYVLTGEQEYEAALQDLEFPMPRQSMERRLELMNLLLEEREKPAPATVLSKDLLGGFGRPEVNFLGLPAFGLFLGFLVFRDRRAWLGLPFGLLLAGAFSPFMESHQAAAFLEAVREKGRLCIHPSPGTEECAQLLVATLRSQGVNASFCMDYPLMQLEVSEDPSEFYVGPISYAVYRTRLPEACGPAYLFLVSFSPSS